MTDDEGERGGGGDAQGRARRQGQNMPTKLNEVAERATWLASLAEGKHPLGRVATLNQPTNIGNPDSIDEDISHSAPDYPEV